ncbi:MAG: hypothetical protein RLZZ241_602 [Bacteroidota bacterium]|jgi:hypothetical protein
MKKFNFYIVLAFVTLISCTDESTFSNPVFFQLEKGGFIRFQNENAILNMYPDPQNISISEPIYDPNDNVSSYSLSVSAIVNGSLYVAEDFITITTFPSTLEITSQGLADALGVNVSDFFYGDTFAFTSKVTRNDGKVFYGLTPKYDSTNGTLGFGTTHPNLLDKKSYTNAMTFGFILFTDCPPVPGTYKVDIHDSWGDGWQGKGILVTLDGVEQYIALCSNWGSFSVEGCLDGGGEYKNDTFELVVPEGTESWSWTWTGDGYPGECSFEIYKPDGSLLFSKSAPEVGMLPVINCL